jgi:hypothetical protein
LQPIDYKWFIAIHVSHKHLRLRFLAHSLPWGKDSVFQRNYGFSEQDSPEPLAAAGMTTSGAASSAPQAEQPSFLDKARRRGSHAKSVRQRNESNHEAMGLMPSQHCAADS